MNSLPLFIYSTVRSGEPMAIARAFAAASVLLFLVLSLFVVARVLARPRTTRSGRTKRLAARLLESK
jgi:phosphate transport system permease protein